MLLMALFLSALLLIVTNAVAARGSIGAIGRASGIAGVGFVLGLGCLYSVAFALHALLVGLAGLICLAARPKPWLFLKSSLAAMAMAYGILTAFAIADLREWARLRQLYPFESMTERLAYEKRQQRMPGKAAEEIVSNNAVSGSARDESPPILERLAALEENIDQKDRVFDDVGSSGPFRVRSLMWLHSGYVQQFIQSPGFGIGRMVRGPSPFYLKIREAEPIPLPPPDYEDPSKPDENPEELLQLGSTVAGKTMSAPDALEQLHEEGLVDFVNPKRFGYVKDREHVAGFKAHEFIAMPLLKTPEKEMERWLVQRLELVSLLKFEEPGVYLSEHLPRMGELRHAKTRALDSFETRALAALRRGEDLSVAYSKDRIRMLGSIRAVRQCVRCHQVDRGGLLGAFSYKLQRELPIP